MTFVNYHYINYIKNLIFLGLLAVFELASLYLFLLPFHSVDWEIQWAAATYIVEGIPLYEQGVFSIPSEKLILPPHHFPIFFYLLAIVALVQSEVVGKVFMWILFNIMVFMYFKILQPETETEGIFLLSLLFLHPTIIGFSFYKPFDSLMAIFILLAYQSYKNRQYIRTGVFIGIAVGIKFIPILLLVPIAIQLIQEKKAKELVQVIGSTIMVILTQIIFYMLYFENFINATILWQYERGHITFALWGHFFPDFFASSYFVIMQLAVLASTCIILLIMSQTRYRLSFWSNYVIIISMFIFVYRTHYGHYGIWYFIGLVFIYYSLFQKRRYFYLIVLGLIEMIYYSSIFLCGQDCMTPTALNLIQQIAILSISATLFLIPIALIILENSGNHADMKATIPN